MTTYQGVAGAYPKVSPYTDDAGNGNVPMNGMFGVNFARRIADVKDGLSNTLCMGEWVQIDPEGSSGAQVGSSVPPGKRSPVDPRCLLRRVRPVHRQVLADYPLNARWIPIVASSSNWLPFGSFHPGGANFLLADGSVTFLSDSILLDLYWKLGTSTAASQSLSLIPR